MSFKFLRNRHYYVLIICVAVGFGARWLLRDLPMRYDETYTFLYFASYTLQWAIGNYSLPNNHVLHSVLVFFSTQVFGNQPWAIRLPAMLAGTALVGSTYFAARQFFNRKVALIAAALVSAWPVLMTFSANARGYSLTWLLATLMLGLAAKIIQKPEVWKWMLMSVLFALGLYTIPVMAYPAAMIYAWLGISWLKRGQESQLRAGHLFDLVFSAISGMGIAYLLYLPIIQRHGLMQIISNRYTESLSFDGFFDGFPDMIPLILSQMNADLPSLIAVIALLAFVFGIWFNRKTQPQQPNFMLVALITQLVVLIVQRVLPPSRVFLFITPFYLIWVAAGLYWAIDSGMGLLAKSKSKSLLSYLLILIALGSGFIYSLRASENGNPAPGIQQKIVQVLLEQGDLDDHDLILANRFHSHRLRYYLVLENYSRDLVGVSEQAELDQVYIVFDPNYDDAPEDLLTDELRNIFDVESIERLGRAGNAEIYLLESQQNPVGNN